MKTLGKVVPSGSGGTGNTIVPPRKRVSAAKSWCFTLNNYTEEDVGSMKNIITKWCKYGIFGFEVGENGTPHLQGYIEFKNKDRPMNKKYLWSKRIHWEKGKGSRKQNDEYCQKDGDFWVYPKPYSIDIELYKWEIELLDILKTDPDDRTIYWIWESKGCAGKTVFQKWYHLNRKKRTICLSGKAADMKHAIVEYKKHNDCLPEVIFINIPRVSGNHISIAGLEQIKDMWFHSSKYEGGMVNGPNPHVMVFANEEPEEEVLSNDRVKIKYIGSEGQEPQSKTPAI